MASEPFHPRREAMAQTLARAFQLPERDKEEQIERHTLRLIEIREALRK